MARLFVSLPKGAVMVKLIGFALLFLLIIALLKMLYHYQKYKRNPADKMSHLKRRKSLILSFIIAAFFVSLFFTRALIPYYAFELGGQGLKPEALRAMNEIRIKTGYRWLIYSGYRAPSHNQKVGGASQSQHVVGVAFDVKVPHEKRAKFYRAAKDAGFTAFGWGNNTVHIDMGPARWWTYDDKGRAMGGQRKYQYLHKAPLNFRQDWGL